MADSPQENMTTRSLLKQIIATEPTRSAVRYNLRKRTSQHERSPSSRTPQRRKTDGTVSSPLHTVHSKMKERVRRSLRRESMVNPRRESLTPIDLTVTRRGAKGLQGYVEDLDGITPRSLLRKIIQNEPEVSLIVSQKYDPVTSTSTEPEMTLGRSLSSVGDLGISLLQLQEEEGTRAFGKAKKKRRMSISQFEEGVNLRLTQPEEHSKDVTQQSGIDSMSVHELQEDERTNAFGNATKKKRMSVTQFEQGVEQRLTQTEMSTVRGFTQPSKVQPLLTDQSSITTFLQSSNLDTSAEPELVQKHGLVRRPRKFNFVSLEDFEQGVHENYNLLKGSQECFVESASEDTDIQNETAHMNTELYAQPGGSERNPPKADASQKATEEANLSNKSQTEEVYEKPMETDIEESYIQPLTQEQDLLKSVSQMEGEFKDYPLNAADIEEATNESIQANDNAGDGDEQLILEESPMQDSDKHTSQTNEGKENQESSIPNAPEESVMLISPELTLDSHTEYKSFATPVIKSPEIEQEPPEASRKERLSPTNNSWGSLLQKPTTQASSPLPSAVSSITGKEGDQQEDSQMSEQSEELIAKRTDTALEERTITDSEESRSEELSFVVNQKVTPVKQMLYPLTDTPAYVKNANLKITKKPQAGKIAQRKKNVTRKKEPALSSSFIKQLVNHSTRMKVAKDSYKEVEKCLNIYFEQLCGDLTAYATHANRKTVTCADIELLMRRQGLVTDAVPLNLLIERHLPMEYRRCLIPCASSGNKVYPKTKF